MAFLIAHRDNVLIPEVVYHPGKRYIMRNTLPAPYGVNGLDGWFKKLRRAVTSAVKAPFKIATRLVKGDIKGAAGVFVNPFAEQEATRGRTLRRAGGVITGAVTGFLTGAGPVGMIAGGIYGGVAAKKGVKGIKGYGMIAIKSAAVAGAAGIATGALAQVGFAQGLVSQQAAQTAIMASGKLGMVGTGFAAGAPIGASMAMAPVTKAIASGASVIGGAGTKIVGAGMTLLGAMKKPAPTDEGMVMPEPSFMDTITQTQSLIPNVTGARADVPYGYGSSQGSWGGGAVPLPTGSTLPGQEPTYAEAGVLGGDNIKTILLIGGLGLLVFGFIKTK